MSDTKVLPPLSTTRAQADMAARVAYVINKYNYSGELAKQKADLLASRHDRSFTDMPNRDVISEYTADEVLYHVTQRRGWDDRPGQRDMVNEIELGDNCIISAPVGIGKTLGYLVPGLLYHSQVMVVTSTKALQDQVANKEMPRLAEDLDAIYGFMPRWTIIKGKGNYLDKSRYDQLVAHSTSDDKKALGLTPDIHKAIEEENNRLNSLINDPNCHGFDSEALFSELPPDLVSAICAKDSEARWVKLTYVRAFAFSEVIVANTAYVVSTLEVSGGDMSPVSLPHMVIFDEAHHLHNVVTDAKTSEFHPDELSAEVHRLSQTYGKAFGAAVTGKMEELAGDIARTKSWVTKLEDTHHDARQRAFIANRLTPLHHSIEKIIKLMRADEDVPVSQCSFVEIPPTLMAANVHNSIHMRVHKKHLIAATAIIDAFAAMRIGLTLENIGKVWDDHFTHYFSLSTDKTSGYKFTDAPKPENIKGFGLAPISVDTFGADIERMAQSSDIAELMSAASDVDVQSIIASVYGGDLTYDIIPLIDEETDRKRQIVLTSGTVSEDIKYPLGMDEYYYMKAASPYDPNMFRLYIPPMKNTPNGNREAWAKEFAQLCERMVKNSGGRALILTASIQNMNDVYNHLTTQPAISDKYTIMRQGDAGKTELLEWFARDETSILVGTKSFWEGVDIPGRALQMVIIDKIPFPPPRTSVKAREEYSRQNDGTPFEEVSILDASQMIAQGAGRLIRSENDYGTIVIADTRLNTASYAWKVLRLLPAGTVKEKDPEAMSAWFTYVRDRNTAEDAHAEGIFDIDIPTPPLPSSSSDRSSTRGGRPILDTPEAIALYKQRAVEKHKKFLDVMAGDDDDDDDFDTVDQGEKEQAREFAQALGVRKDSSGKPKDIAALQAQEQSTGSVSDPDFAHAKPIVPRKIRPRL